MDELGVKWKVKRGWRSIGVVRPKEISLRSLGASILAHFYELGPRLFQLGRGYSDSALDPMVFIIIVAFFVSVALTIFSVRRYRDLARETKARTVAEIEARDLARHDPLTGLPNRRLFDENFHASLRLAGHTRRIAVLMLGLVGLKRIKETHGHAAGEKALCEIAHRLGDVLRVDGVLARIGGDEFGIFLPDISSLEDPINLARRIVASAAGTFSIETGAAELDVDIGVAIAPIDGVNLHELVRRAERTLYRARGDGGRLFAFSNQKWTCMLSGASRSSGNFAALSRRMSSSRTTSLSFRLAVIASSGSRPWRVGEVGALGIFRPICLFRLQRGPDKRARRSASSPGLFRCQYVAGDVYACLQYFARSVA